MYRIMLLPGDTVGPELIRQVKKAILALGEIANEKFEILECLSGVSALEATGDPLPQETVLKAQQANAVLLGNIGSAKDAALPLEKRPEYALLKLRKIMKVCTNLRPVFIRESLRSMSPLKESFLEKGFDIMTVRDIQGGMLAGVRDTGIGSHGRMASDLEYYDEQMIAHSARMAFEIAGTRKKQVTSLDKANVLVSSLLWRQKVTEVAGDYPDIRLSHQYIDSAAMNVIKSPGKFDVILTSNVFGDILSDELAQLSGTPNLFGSAELAVDRRGIYTSNQLHYPREELAGQNQVCPVGLLNALAMLLDYSCQRPDLAKYVYQSLDGMFREKLITPEFPVPRFTLISTEEYGDEIVRRIHLLKDM